MLYKIFQDVFENSFRAQFVLFLGAGWAFSRLTRPEREAHGWSFWNWSLDDLEFGKASALLAAWVFGILIVKAIREYRRAKKRRLV